MKYQNIVKIGVLSLVLAVGVSCSSTSNQGQSGQRPQQSQGGQGGQQGQPSVSDLISEMDSNGDGKLSESEVQGPLKSDFSTIDTNDDGYLSEDELENAPKPQGGPQGGGQR